MAAGGDYLTTFSVDRGLKSQGTNRGGRGQAVFHNAAG